MEELLTAITQYHSKYHEYPKVQMNRYFYEWMGSDLPCEIEVTEEVDGWELPEAEPIVDFCCGARSTENGCCPW